MICDIESSSESWLDYMRSVPEAEAAAALDAADHFMRQTCRPQSANRRRLKEIITQGEQIYESRFGESWAPF